MTKKFFIIWVGLLTTFVAYTQPFYLPTNNKDVLDPNTFTNYFVPTVVGTWKSGTFGSVRSNRLQIHEGWDIRCKNRDKKGEAIDPILCVADGTVVYISSQPGNSNYGRYIVVKHNVSGIDVYTLYAHLSTIGTGIKVGSKIVAGTHLGIMGRSSNSRSSISKERAHLHFEICLLLNTYFEQWFRLNNPKDPISHKIYNGRNLAGIDPITVYNTQSIEGEKFDFVRLVKNQTKLCEVLIKEKNFPYASKYPQFVTNINNLKAEQITGYKVVFNFNGLPISLTPCTASETAKIKEKYTLLSVNEKEQEHNPARGFLTKSSGKWKITNKFKSYLDQITWIPKK
jgi:hypothetical protein